MYITDLDGTLLNNDAALTAASVGCINRLIEQGLLFSYATARSYSSAHPLTKALNLNLPLATYNGAFVVEPKEGRILEMELIPPAELNFLRQILDAEGLFPMVNAVIDGRECVSWVTGKETEGISRYLATKRNSKRLRPVETFSQLFAGSVFYMTLIGDKDDFGSLATEAARRKNLNSNLQMDTYAAEYWLEIFSSRASKAYAVKS